jgi:hypothetical protein
LAVVAGETEKLELRQDRHTEPRGRPLAVPFNRIGNVYNFSQIGQQAVGRSLSLFFSLWEERFDRGNRLSGVVNLTRAFIGMK